MDAPYIRFDMLFEGEAQDVGILVGLKATGIDEELEEELTEPFHNRLAIPCYKNWEPAPQGYFPGAYFTKAGYIQFQEHIDDIIDAINEMNNGWQVRVTERDGFPEEDIFYADECQIIAITAYDSMLVDKHVNDVEKEGALTLMNEKMNAPYIRFEMAFQGDEQQVGFLTGLDDTGMNEEFVEELMEPFNRSLSVPPYRDWESNAEHFPGAYFTRAGYLRYKEDIDRIIRAVKYRDNGWEVVAIQSYEFPDDHLYYEDEHQAIVKTYYAENMATA